MIKKCVLHNNSILITEPIACVQTVSIGFWFPVGSRDEVAQKGRSASRVPPLRGVTHFVEHLLFKGTKSMSSYDIAREFDCFGGYLNAFTEREVLCVHCVVPSSYVERAIHIMCDMITNSSFTSDDVEKERAVIESEIISALDDPEEAAMDAVFEKIWRDVSFSQSIAGTVADIGSLTREVLYEWYNTHIVNGQLIIGIAGNFCEEHVTSQLESLPARSVYTACVQTSAEDNFSGAEFFIKASFQQSQLFLIYPIDIPHSYEEYYIWEILNALIGDTMSSRLFQRLREQTGYCYNVYSFYQIFRDRAFFASYASSSKKNMKKVIPDLHHELSEIYTKGFSKSEVDDAVAHICGCQIIASEDTENRMKRLIQQFLYGFDLISVEQSFDCIRSVSKIQVEHAFERLYENKKRAQVVYGQKI